MGAVSGRRTLGLFDSGRGENPSDPNWTNNFVHYTADSLSDGGCWARLANTYGSAAISGRYIPVDPVNKRYVMSVSVRTLTNSYLGRLGSGHLGFACYDASLNFISHHEAFSTSNTTLSRAANPGDTKIYIANADANMISAFNTTNSADRRSLNFYFAGSPYPTVGGYTRYNMYANVVQNSLVQTGSGDWEITFTTGLPNWGYTFAIGTPVGRTLSGGSYNYALGAPNYPSTWTTYTTPVMTGYVTETASSGANFRDGTKYIRFLNLMNYNYRTETAGASAQYLLDNILLFEFADDTKAVKVRASDIHRRTRILR